MDKKLANLCPQDITVRKSWAVCGVDQKLPNSVEGFYKLYTATLGPFCV